MLSITLSSGVTARLPRRSMRMLWIGALVAASAQAQAPETMRFPSADGHTTLVGYLWLPSNPGPHPAVVMLHGRAGSYSSLAHGVYTAATLSKRHQAWGAFWAERGYVALHVDSFGPRGYPAGFPRFSYKDRPEAVSEQTVRPLDAYGALAYLRQRPDVIADRIGLQGWSNGGSATLVTMSDHAPGIAHPSPKRGFRAALAFYPGCDLSVYKHDYAAYAPLLVFLGSDDEEVSPAICERVVPQDQRSQWVLYPGATHDFDDPGEERHSVAANRAASDDAHRRAEAFFAAQLRDVTSN
jgi:carboxymethylenebutenolidase